MNRVQRKMRKDQCRCVRRAEPNDDAWLHSDAYLLCTGAYKLCTHLHRSRLRNSAENHQSILFLWKCSPFAIYNVKFDVFRIDFDEMCRKFK